VKLVADECIPLPVVEHLRAVGHEVIWIRDLAAGAPDPAVLERALLLEAPLLTEDLDFGELVFRDQFGSAGVIILRMSGLSNASKAHTLASALRDHEAQLIGALTVISPGQIRIRRLET
jgi:predicted nuclease of predicted toxin-antitoxin system